MKINILCNSDICTIIFNQKLFVLQPLNTWHWFAIHLTFQHNVLSRLKFQLFWGQFQLHFTLNNTMQYTACIMKCNNIKREENRRLQHIEQKIYIDEAITESTRQHNAILQWPPLADQPMISRSKVSGSITHHKKFTPIWGAPCWGRDPTKFHLPRPAIQKFKTMLPFRLLSVRPDVCLNDPA